MSVYADIQSDQITNVIHCDDAGYAAQQGWTQIDTLDPQPGIGWTLQAGAWTPPAPSPQQQNAATLRQAAHAAIQDNIEFLTLGSPSSLEAVAQVQALTRQSTALIRLLLGALDSTSGT